MINLGSWILHGGTQSAQHIYHHQLSYSRITLQTQVLFALVSVHPPMVLVVRYLLGDYPSQALRCSEVLLRYKHGIADCQMLSSNQQLMSLAACLYSIKPVDPSQISADGTGCPHSINTCSALFLQIII